MASQDYISQFSQGIPSTQPDRSPSRTPRRTNGSTPLDPSVPTFRGPLHMAANYYRPPNFGYNPTWTPPRLPLTPSSTTPSPLRWPNVQHPAYPTQSLFPPMPPTQSPPPPPPQTMTTPQRFPTTSPKSHSFTPPPSVSQIQKGYPVRICETQPCPSGNLTLTSTTRARPTASTSLPQSAPANSHSSRILKGWIHCRFPSGSFCIKA